MVRFYLDMEFTNGNYYLADIIEIALVAEDSGYTFHSYVKIHYSIPRQVQQLTNISNNMTRTIGLSFTKVMEGLVEFIDQESDSLPPIIIAHGGYLHDFPILLANCMKHNIDYTPLTMYTFVDSMQLFQDDGYTKPGLDALCERFDIDSKRHSALEDAKVLKTICNMNPDIMDHPYGYTLKDIRHHLDIKLPISILSIYELARYCSSYQELEDVLYEHVTRKTALNKVLICKVAYWYFKDRY